MRTARVSWWANLISTTPVRNVAEKKARVDLL
jgi:hypothetical protein